MDHSAGGSEETSGRLRAVRGATTADADEADAIIQATGELLERMLGTNAIATDDVVSAIFTVTPDLASAFPARAARGLGWDDVPLLCALAPAVAGDPARCIRALVHFETQLGRRDVQHIYLHGARALRPDLTIG